MSKDRKRDKDKEPEILDSTKDEVFIHQTLRKFGASPEEAIAFAKIYGKMISEIADRLVERVDMRADAQEAKLNILAWVLGGGLGFLTLVITLLTLFVALRGLGS